MIRSRRKAGFGSAAILALFVLGAIGAGAWNYQRNLALEQAARTSRPLAGYDTADLEALADAYRSEVAAGAARHASARQQRAVARERAYLDEQVQEFEKVQRAASRSRAVGGELAEREAALRDVEQELALRGAEPSEWQRHWRRLTAF